MSKDRDQLSRRLHQFSTPAFAGVSLRNPAVSTPRQIKDLNGTTAAYIAGLVDGEGTITLVRKHKNENRQLCVSISSTEIDMLKFVKASTGVGKITNKRTTKRRHSPSFAYAVYNRQALGLLSQIQPYLISYKKKRAELILKDYLAFTPRNGKYTTELLARKHAFEKEVLSITANSQSAC